MREDDVLVEIHAAGVNPWIPRSETENSNCSCPIDCRSFSVTSWQES